MTRKFFVATVCFFFSSPVLAGVEFEIEITDYGMANAFSSIASAMDAAGAEAAGEEESRTETSTVSVEGMKIKMGVGGGNGSEEMVFNGDRAEMIFISHGERAYMVIDEATVAAAGAEIEKQLAGADAQIQKMLESVPADQRPALEQLMKQNMPPQMRGQETSQRKAEMRRTGETATRNGYPCVKYEVLVDGRKVRELWVTDWNNIEGGDEAVDAFENMGDFFVVLENALPDFGQGPGMEDNPFSNMRELGGFPVVTREFDDYGELESEAQLRSATRRALDPDAFDPPSGYKRQEMFRR